MTDAEAREMARDLMRGGTAASQFIAQVLKEANDSHIKPMRCEDKVKGKCIEELEAKLATCEKYRDAYADCDRIGTQAVRDLEAKLSKCEALLAKSVEAWIRVNQHEGVIIECHGDDAANTWNALCATLAELKGQGDE